MTDQLKFCVNTGTEVKPNQTPAFKSRFRPVGSLTCNSVFHSNGSDRSKRNAFSFFRVRLKASEGAEGRRQYAPVQLHFPPPPLTKITGNHQRNTSCNAPGVLYPPLLQTIAARGEEPRKKVWRQEDSPERQISRWRALPCPVPAVSSLFVSPVFSPTTGGRGVGDQNISNVILHPPLPKGKCNNATSVSTRLLQRCLINTLFLQARSWQE